MQTDVAIVGAGPDGLVLTIEPARIQWVDAQASRASRLPKSSTKAATWAGAVQMGT